MSDLPVQRLRRPVLGEAEDIPTPASSQTPRPANVPTENWLPINRTDQVLNSRLRVYAPNAERMKTWQTPKAKRVANP